MKRLPLSKLIAIFLLLVIAVMVILSFMPWVDPFTMGTPYQRPSSEHPLGTNDIGQDILAEILYGSRVSLLIGTISAVIITFIGTAIGVCAGYFGGWVDTVLSWFIHVAMTIPSLPMTIVLIAYFGGSIKNVIVIICLTSWAGTARIIRAKARQISQLPYIKLEENMGISTPRLLLVHIVPNISDILFIRGVMAIPSAILTETGLSFLGFGDSAMRSWGTTLRYAFYRNGVLNNYWWWIAPPILCICMCSLGFLLLGYNNKRVSESEIG